MTRLPPLLLKFAQESPMMVHPGKQPYSTPDIRRVGPGKANPAGPGPVNLVGAGKQPPSLVQAALGTTSGAVGAVNRGPLMVHPGKQPYSVPDVRRVGPSLTPPVDRGPLMIHANKSYPGFPSNDVTRMINGKFPATDAPSRLQAILSGVGN